MACSCCFHVKMAENLFVAERAHINHHRETEEAQSLQKSKGTVVFMEYFMEYMANIIFNGNPFTLQWQCTQCTNLISMVNVSNIF